MKANELRLNNYYQLKGGVLGGGVCRIGTIQDFVKVHELIHSNSIYPIELTEEWLIKFGFESDGIEWWDGVICLGIFKDGLYYLPTENINDRSGKEIKYVHQLQNLYWCLCEEELNFNR